MGVLVRVGVASAVVPGDGDVLAMAVPATVGTVVGGGVSAAMVGAVLCVGAGLTATTVCVSDVQSREAERSMRPRAIKKITTASNAFQEI